MASYLDLDADGVARTGLLFLDGDELEKAVIDKFGQVDYDFVYFNRVKADVMRIEKINPSLQLTAVVWQRHLENENFMYPMVAGNSLPREGYSYAPVNAKARAAFNGSFGEVLDRGGVKSHYYPLYNSSHEITGVLELLAGERSANDI